MRDRLRALWAALCRLADHPRLRAVLDRLTAGDETAEDAALHGERRLIRWSAATMALFVLWAMLFELDIAAHAPGKVVPAGQVKRIQHLEGGIVRSIFVKEGEHVQAGQPLVELESTATQADLQEIQTRIATLKINAARLQALLDGAPRMAAAPELQSAYPGQWQSAEELFASHQSRLRNAIAEQDLKIRQRQAEIEEMRSRLSHTSSRHKLLSNQVSINEQLLSQGLVNDYEHLELRKEEQTLRGQIAETRATLSRVVAGLAQEKVALDSLKSGEDEQLRKELSDTTRELAEFGERVRKFADSRARTTIRAPIDGVVMTLYVVTTGGVVAPGGTVLTMVPGGDRLVVEARLPVGEVGFLRQGQPVRLQLVSAAGRGFQPLNGTVAHISPDSVVEAEQEPFYLVRIAPGGDSFASGDSRYPLRPGVVVDASILTGSRSVLGYILDPFLSGLGNGLRER